MMEYKFVAKLFVMNNDDDDVVNESAVVEVVDTDADNVEIVFVDRGERVYLTFKLADLVGMAHAFGRKRSET